ncbi:MAG TPA: VIT domain-containing protein [Polyangiales bacterium]|nr:VIT domain-containing protein [Polyangiales bacterium]
MQTKAWVFSLLFLAVPLGAASAQEPTERSLSPYFIVEGAPDGVEPFALEATKVHAAVSGVIADVTVEQTYRNGGTVPINARYVFPASTRAAVHGLWFELGNRRVVAKIKEREQAAQEYKAAAESGKTATLLEQERPNVFSMSVANILPGDRVVVQLQYSELLVPSEGVYQFVYPTVVGPRYKSPSGKVSGDGSDNFVASRFLHFGDVPDTKFDLDVALSTGVPIASVRSSTHKVDVAWEDKSFARVKLAANSGFGGNRDFILDYKLRGAQIQSGLLMYEGKDENHFLLMVQPPARVASDAIPAREYVFVLDVSGSMYGFPLDTAKALISRLIGQLRPVDTFNVLLFSGDSRLMADRSITATADNVRKAVKLIDQERGGGGTELEAALRVVGALPRSEHVSRSVIVLTDGYIAEERGAFDLIRHNIQNTNVFAFGIGSSVNRYLIEGLARAGQGEPFIVTDPSQAPATAERFRKYIQSPVLTDVRVRFDGFDAYDVEPELQADLFAERPIVVFGKWRGARAGSIEVLGRTASGAFRAQLPVAMSDARAENAALPQLWARSRIARLSDFAGEDASLQRQVTELGLRYGLLTKYTSFIAVLEQIRNPGGNAQNVDQPLPLPAGVSELAVSGGEYASGAEPELIWLVGLLLAGFAWTSWRRKTAAARSGA